MRNRGHMRLSFTFLVIALTAPATAAAERQLPLVAGELRLPAASSFGDPGFHHALAAGGRVPANLRPSARFRLVLTLRDASRTEQKCSSDHPLSGCATVDWADDPSRPKVPESGVFANTVTVRLASGSRAFFLVPSGSLAGRPIPYAPG